MRLALALFAVLALSSFTSTALRAEDAADAQAQIKQLTAELEATKVQLKAVQAQKNEAQLRLDTYKKYYEKLLEAVQSEQTLGNIKEAASKVEGEATDRIARLDEVIKKQKKE